MTEEEYDELIELLQRESPRDWVKARSVEDAMAFQAWCIENGIESPEVRIVH